MMDYAKKYNKIYSDHAVTFGDGKPDRVIQDILKYRTNGSVLEIGAGEGRNALYLAQQGFAVTAIDVSSVGLEKLSVLAQKDNLTIETHLADVRTFDLAKNYDVITSTFVFHHLTNEEIGVVINRIQEHTSHGGINAFTVFSTNGDFYRRNPEGGYFYPNEDEFKELYKSWKILEYSELETKALEKKPDGTPMLNIALRIIAQKDL